MAGLPEALHSNVLRCLAPTLTSRLLAIRKSGEFDYEAPAIKAFAQIKIDEDCDREFRTTFVGDFTKLQDELNRRLNLQPSRLDQLPTSTISFGVMLNASARLVGLARQLP